jgi:hypothetical protein
MANWNEMSEAAQKAAEIAASVENYMAIRGKTQITMTEATTAIWGTSGTGNPNAVRRIEAAAYFGFLKIVPHGKRTRYVTVGNKPIPAEAMSEETKAFERKMYLDGIQAEADHFGRKVKEALEKDPSAAPAVFMSELKSFLGGKRR